MRVANTPCNKRPRSLVASKINRYRYVAGLAFKRIDVKGESVSPRLNQRPKSALTVAAGTAQIKLSGSTAFAVKNRLSRNAVVNHIDHTANRASPVLQRPRPAQDFNALNADGVSRNGMVIAERRYIQQAAAIVQNADTVTVLPANDRAAGVRPEVSAAHAGCAVQRFTQRGFRAQQ